MKILFAIKALDDIKGGAERVLCDVASGLAARGHTVSVVSFDAPGGISFYPLSETVKRVTLNIGEAGKRATFLETVKRVYALRRMVCDEKPDAVIAFMHSMFIPAAFALIGTGIPVIGSEHIVPEHYKKRRVEFFLLIISSFFMRQITVLSKPIKKSYPSFVRRKMTAVANPVALPVISNATPREKIILNVARLDPQKDQETLIRAFAIVADEYPDWIVKIFGDGPLHAYLSALIGSLGLQERMILAGTTRHISLEYAQASIFALSSFYESFGLATAEAMAHGLPAIGFADCEGTNKLIVDGKNGLLVKGGARIQEFSKALAILMSDEKRREEMGAFAKDSLSFYAPDVIFDEWEKLIKSSVARVL